MTFDIQALGLDQLSAAEKYQLVEVILGTLPEYVDPGELSPEQLAEVVKRRQAADQNPGVGRHWRDVIADLRKQP
ncbi:addiction module protein [Anatilimnocola floriformis]|uniref:addiction module protein n=1 Tax=Anatilimnocola floriformis TaxID=2948575 RepID=UPI0020C259E9|nr:addiction module protein [Anatilimnocola floriformis]